MPFALSRHLARLGRSAAGLGLAAPDLDQIREGALAVIQAPGVPALARMRITVTGGIAPLGSERGGSPLTAIVALGEMKPPAPACDVTTVPWPRNEHGALSGLKTTSYGENVRALAYAAEHGGSEAIFGNTAGNLCEGTGTNVFVVSDGQAAHPAAVRRVPGRGDPGPGHRVGRRRRAGPAAGGAGDADEAFLTGTTRDVQPIRSVDGRALPAAPGTDHHKSR